MELCTSITCTDITQHLGTALMSHWIAAALLHCATKESSWGFYWCSQCSDIWAKIEFFKYTLQRNFDPEMQSQEGSYLKFCPNYRYNFRTFATVPKDWLSLHICGWDALCYQLFWGWTQNLPATRAVVDNHSYLSRHSCISNFSIIILITPC